MSVKGMAIEEVLPTKNVAEELRIEEHVTGYRVQRVLCTDGNSLCMATNYLKSQFVPGLDEYTNRFVGLYNFIERTYGVSITEA